MCKSPSFCCTMLIFASVCLLMMILCTIKALMVSKAAIFVAKQRLWQLWHRCTFRGCSILKIYSSVREQIWKYKCNELCKFWHRFVITCRPWDCNNTFFCWWRHHHDHPQLLYYALYLQLLDFYLHLDQEEHMILIYHQYVQDLFLSSCDLNMWIPQCVPIWEFNI